MESRDLKEIDSKDLQKTEEGKDFLEVFITKSLHQAMGKSLDLFRISEISDRSMEQIRRTLKDYYNQLIVYVVEVLREKGYIKETPKE